MQSRTYILPLLVAIFINQWSFGQSFIENKGQWPAQVLYKAQLPEASIYCEQAKILFNLKDLDEHASLEHHHGETLPIPDKLHFHAYDIEFINAPAHSSAQGKYPKQGTHNYFIGNNPSNWGSNAKAFRQISYSNLYPGIDADIYFNQEGLLKYDLILAPHTDPNSIQIAYNGVKPKLDESGNLIILTSVNTITEAKPYAYQIIDGVKHEVICNYVLKSNKLSFELEAYNTSLELIIDPILKFSTYSGSTANNFGYTATFDQAGFLYSGSSVFDDGYPTTLGAYDIDFSGGSVDFAISKFDTTGSFLVYSTYIGGGSSELPHSIIVNEQDELFVYGTTGSDNFPVTANAYDQTFSGGFGFNPDGLGVTYANGSDIFISKLSFDGTQLLSSTYVGGTSNDGLNRGPDTKFNYADEIRGEIDFDADGNILIASSSNNTNNNTDNNTFPTTTGVIGQSYQGGTQDGVIFKMDPNLNDMIWSTFFGGNGQDAAYSITSNEEGHIIVAGGTNSNDLPTSSGVLSSNYQGGQADGWALVLNADATEILHCSYWGTGTYDQAYMVELDGQGNIHLFGQTFSGNEFIVNAGYSNANSGQFISKLSPELNNIIWSTAFGNGNNQPNISPTAFLVDLCDRIYLSGWGGTTGGIGLTTDGLPITADAFQSTTDGSDFYLMALLDDASDLVYGTYYGGDLSAEHVDGGTSRFDRKGKVYQSVCAGCGGNDDFPIFPGPNDVVSATNGSSCNNGVFKMDFELPAVIADFIYTPICLPDTAHFLNTSAGGLTFEWNFGDGSTSDDVQAAHFYENPGLYQVTLIISDPFSCNLADTIHKDIFIFDPNGAQLADTVICSGETVQLGFAPLPVPGLSYSWNNAQFLDNPTISNPTATVTENTVFTLDIDNGVCPSTATQLVEVESLNLTLSPDTIICDGDELTLSASTLGITDNYVWSSNASFADTLSTDSSLTVIPLTASTYYLSAEENCRIEGSINVGLFSDFISFSTSQYICAGDQVDLAVFNSSPDISIDVNWSPDAPIVTGQGTDSISIVSAEDLWMHAEVISSEGCVLQDSIFIEISPLSFLEVDATGDPLLIPLGDQSFLNTEPNGPYDYSWTPSDGLNSPSVSNPTASPNQTTTYTVTVSDNGLGEGCIRSDTITVHVFEFLCAFPTTFIPNAFSPNKDGHNEVLYVRGEYISSFDLKIYDRWGEIVFQSQEKEHGWDGTYRGKLLERGVYVYHLDVECIDGQRNFEKGNITLIR